MLLLGGTLTPAAGAQGGGSPGEQPAPGHRNLPELPVDLRAAFSPPANLADDFGAFRPVLRFDDGRPVQSAGDWAARRREITAAWERILGPWPPLLAEPRMLVLTSQHRETFIQHRVRLPVAPGQTAEGWLLIPDGRGPFPAVFVPYYEPETSIGLGQPLRDFGYQLTRRGFVSLSIGSPGGDARRPDRGRLAANPCPSWPMWPRTAPTHWPPCRRWTRTAWGSWATVTAANGRCSPRHCTTGSPPSPSVIPALCGMKPDPT
ncbi:MAG: hypothetical protein M5U12_29505 [Verrucomicrobia bacterium]|nr:hypothetical protein [Verrucomicrobiota bacterium]